MKSVPFFNYPHVFRSYEEQFKKAFHDVGNRGAFIMQSDLVEFEKSIAEYVGVKYALGVANATDGLQMGMMAGGIGPGDEVIFCSHTMVATASAIHFAGGIPVPIETGPDHLIDIDSIEAAITSKTKAICPTQLNGRTANMDAIREIAVKHGLLIFEDAAQALGSKFKGKCAGTFGVASCISLYPAKILGCLGDGGLVLTNDDSVYEKLHQMRDHGRGHDGDVHMWGLNSRLDNLQAAFLNVQFKDYPAVTSRRRQLASLYQDRLSRIEQLSLPVAPDADPDHFDVFQNYEIEAENRDELKIYLAEKGIGTLIQWGGKAVHQFTKLGFNQKLPKTESLFKKMIMIPMNMSMTDEDLHYVCDSIESFYAN
ncbi:DegT/DnrJ/EryC1/StrS family aminotransferase [Pelagicoccus enzymogenes]|uniref:DegT/DnrJ/EryC1/StrS family aminotransferase n=1 Tax=Pelagicoccus enzymogenes TaxID=2773457 RepID=UPI00280D83FF|nr:DegT/DnrJ/EryC1/StrS family aminotransferase [Pelagicoccus enzymogenes]MDQ8199786.1 DegT/DnrJ/EryC1/StrS family aminotransferase [Pelagicoccus enzymogenes]